MAVATVRLPSKHRTGRAFCAGGRVSRDALPFDATTEGKSSYDSSTGTSHFATFAANQRTMRELRATIGSCVHDTDISRRDRKHLSRADSDNALQFQWR